MVRTTHAGQTGDYEQMALDWCAKVDGVNIFPKLPVYLRTHHARWQRNERVRRAVEIHKKNSCDQALLPERTRPYAVLTYERQASLPMDMF